MTQNNIYMEDENLEIVVNVLPDAEDAIMNAVSSASASAASASASATESSNILDNIGNIKTGLELFVTQALEGLQDLYSNLSAQLSSLKETCLQNINAACSSATELIRQTENTIITRICNLGNGYVNEAREYAQSAQQIVDFHVSSEHLNQSKCLPAGNISEDITALESIKNHAHSTFDLSKFTVVGSPTITDDGIFSYKSSNISNFLKTVKVIDFMNANNIRIYFRCKTPTTFPSTNIIVFGNSATQDTEQLMFLSLLASNHKFSVRGDNTNEVKLDTWYSGYYEENGVEHILHLIDESTSEVNEFSVDNTNISRTSDLFGIGCWSRTVEDVNYVWQGLIDLKHFSITVDGVPVFSGNKTGIDTIKTDDYTAVGTPTISADGVAGGFSGDNRITFPIIQLGNYNSWEIHCGFKTPSTAPSGSGGIFNITYNTYYGGCYISFTNNKKLYIQASSTTDNSGQFISATSNALQLDTNYNIVYKFTGTKYIVTLNGEEIYSLDSTTKVTSSIDTCILGCRAASEYFTGSIDLNSFKIYADGDLVYQPCLKIPYTESKTGSKITNAIYRDRVTDVFNQRYLNRYYTLDEYNGNFTLPIGDLYGMIEQLRQKVEILCSQE